jgi:hypothetical protein
MNALGSSRRLGEGVSVLGDAREDQLHALRTPQHATGVDFHACLSESSSCRLRARKAEVAEKNQKPHRLLYDSPSTPHRGLLPLPHQQERAFAT